MNIKERKDLQQELLGIVFNILVESEDSTIQTMELRAVEIIKKLKEHINDDIEHGTGFDSQKMPILDWIVACDSQDHARLHNKSLLKFEKTIKDVGGRSKRNLRSYVGGERETFLNSHFFLNVDERRARDYERLDYVLSNPQRVRLSDMGENMVRQRAREMLDNLSALNRAHDREILLSLSGNRSENIRSPSEVSLNLSGNRNENIRRPREQTQLTEIPLNLFGDRDENVIMRERIRPRGQMQPHYVRSAGGTPPPRISKIKQLVLVVSCIIVGAYFGAIVGMLLAFSCAYFGVITIAEPILLIMGATTAVIGAIVAGTAPILELIEMFKGQEPNLSPSSGLESSNTEHTYLNRQRVI